MSKNIFPQRLKEERKRRNLTQQQLADEVNLETDGNKISRTSITRYENGTRKPDLETLSSISCVLDVDTDYLLGLTNKKHSLCINEEMKIFNNIINSIVEEDDEYTINKLWSILHTFEGILDLSVKNNLLDKTEHIFDSLDTIYVDYANITKNIEVITKSETFLSNLEKEIRFNQFLNSMKPLIIEFLPHTLKYFRKYGKDSLSYTEKETLYLYYKFFATEKVPKDIEPLIAECDADKDFYKKCNEEMFNGVVETLNK